MHILLLLILFQPLIAVSQEGMEYIGMTTSIITMSTPSTQMTAPTPQIMAQKQNTIETQKPVMATTNQMIIPSNNLGIQPSKVAMVDTSKNDTGINSVQLDINNSLGIAYSVTVLEDSVALANNNNLQEAEKKLSEISVWLTDATEYHFDLFKIYSQDSNTLSQSKMQKAYAHDFAELRDKAYFELAKVYIKQNKPKEAVKYLVEIIKSQSNSELGKKSQNILKKIRFVD